MSPRPRLPKLSYADLARAAGTTCDRESAEAFGVSMREVVRWRKDGVPLHIADQVAISIWMHPTSVWGDAWTEAEAVAARRREEVIDARRTRQRERARRLRLAEWSEVDQSWRQWAAQRDRSMP